MARPASLGSGASTAPGPAQSLSATAWALLGCPAAAVWGQNCQLRQAQQGPDIPPEEGRPHGCQLSLACPAWPLLALGLCGRHFSRGSCSVGPGRDTLAGRVRKLRETEAQATHMAHSRDSGKTANPGHPSSQPGAGGWTQAPGSAGWCGSRQAAGHRTVGVELSFRHLLPRDPLGVSGLAVPMPKADPCLSTVRLWGQDRLGVGLDTPLCLLSLTCSQTVGQGSSWTWLTEGNGDGGHPFQGFAQRSWGHETNSV